MVKTKKVKSTGRFGARYGRGIKQRVLDVELKSKAKKTCPYCGKHGKIKRIATGIWYCKKCSKKFTGKAYTLE